ncbi:MAG: PH domain-containing protein [Thermoplasmata archaeon]|nr:PH domain-containing protein [Thermoplasmata archaeon]
MAGSAGVPRTETELLMHRPDSLWPGAFPRRWLRADERILFEARPAFLTMYWGWTTFFVVIFFIGLIGATSPVASSDPSYWGFEAFILIVPLLLIYLSWRGHAYAITNRRVLAVSGIFSTTLQYANYDDIQNFTASPGTEGDLHFYLGHPGSASASPLSAGPLRSVEWDSVPATPLVYVFVQDAFRIHALREVRAARYQTLVDKALENRVSCEYCGALTDLETIDHASPKCQRCGAPVRLQGSLT